MEDGKYIKSDKGTPQGSILSPVLANIVMYYGIMLYMEKVKAQAKGYIEIINYADDIVLCFQYKDEAEKTYKLLEQRLKELRLEFAPDKTRLIEFGRFAEENRKRDGKGKPETFDFLGFTHYCSKSADGTRFRVKRKTSRKKLKQKLKSMKFWLKENRKEELINILATLRRKLIGHYNYYGITDNSKMLEIYYHETQAMLFKWLNRRSQRKSYTSIGFNEMLKIFNLPKPKIKVNIYA